MCPLSRQQMNLLIPANDKYNGKAMMDAKDLCSRIDHTMLKPEATLDDIRNLCAEARSYGFFGVCVNGCWIPTAHDILEHSGVKVIGVVGFPLGAMSEDSKSAETEIAISHGADEIDFVLNIGRLKQGDTQYVLREFKSELEAAHGRPVKVIIETCLLSTEEKILACKLAMDAGMHFVKTSTGLGRSGATVADVRLMRETVGPDIGVKASGGIRNLETAVAMIEAGASRLGTSASAAIIKGD
jgi:deoxyribose-phosphate aldolase